MSLWAAAGWGLLGSLVAEALNLYGMMRPTSGSRGRWQWPWSERRDAPIVIFAVFLRLMAGTGLAVAAGGGNLANTAFATFIFGVAGPLIIAKMFDQVRIVDGPPERHLTGYGGRLDPAERRVLGIMMEGVSYDESQMSSAALMAPSEISAIVNNLVERGILEEEPSSPEGVRYRLSRPAATTE